MMEAYLSFEQALIGDRREPAPFAARQRWLVRESCLAHIVRQPLRLARPGLPSLSLPAGAGPQGLPLGLQLAAPPHRDRDLLQVAAWAETALAA